MSLLFKKNLICTKKVSVGKLWYYRIISASVHPSEKRVLLIEWEGGFQLCHGGSLFLFISIFMIVIHDSKFLTVYILLNKNWPLLLEAQFFCPPPIWGPIFSQHPLLPIEQIFCNLLYHFATYILKNPINHSKPQGYEIYSEWLKEHIFGQIPIFQMFIPERLVTKNLSPTHPHLRVSRWPPPSDYQKI